ncbi:MAG: glycosyltransferase [Candidatus Omnitrophica bacterium]|nr:glycosyltransferase [Candidatus Omnitrophota bacterium]
MEPLVSVIMNCKNGEEYLREAIDSVYAQTYGNWEIIFWDNASTDGSAAIAKSFDKRLRYFKSDRAAALGAARNSAMAEAGGQYLAFLDSDDKWLPEKLKKEVAALEARRDIDLVYTNYYRMIMPSSGRLVLGLKGAQPEGEVFGRFLCDYPVNLQTVMLRTDAVKGPGLRFDDRLEVSEEFDLFMRILFKSKALYIDEPLSVYRMHGGMLSLKSLDKYPVELEYILGKLKQTDASFADKYPSETRYYEAKIGYWYARAGMDKGDPVSARSKLKPHRFTGIKFFILYILTYFPPVIWRSVHRYKAEGRLGWIR